MMFRRIFHFFDRLEDKVRGYLSRYPILYGVVGGFGIVLFWRGVWHSTDVLHQILFRAGFVPVLFDFVDGPLSFVVGSILLLMTGLFVSDFVGSRILMSGLRGEKKMSEKTEAEIKLEGTEIEKIEKDIKRLEDKIVELDSHHHSEVINK